MLTSRFAVLPFCQTAWANQLRVLVFAQGEAQKIAQDAGADSVGGDEIAKKIEEGWLEFDIAIATPDMMPKIGKLGKILGRKGLMPNPKSGTISQPADLPRVIADARKGRVEFKLDKTAIIHTPLGKVSFDDKKLLENLSAIIEAVVKAKPSGAKGQYIKSCHSNHLNGTRNQARPNTNPLPDHLLAVGFIPIQLRQTARHDCAKGEPNGRDCFLRRLYTHLPAEP